MQMTKSRRLALLPAAAAITLLASACGASDSDGGGGGSTPAAFTQDDVAHYLVGPKSISATVPLKKPVPSGIDVVWLDNGFEQPGQMLDGFRTAADTLGWNVSVINIDVTNPPTITSSLDSAISQKPDAIVIPGLDREQFEAAVPAAKAAGVALIPYLSPVKPDPSSGIYPLLGTGTVDRDAATALTQVILADAGSDSQTANVLQMTSPEIAAVMAPLDEGVKSTLDADCPDCTYDLVDVPLADVLAGTHVQKVVSYIQRHPDVNALVANSGLTGAGLEAALAQAGLNQVKVYGFAGSSAQLEAFKDGTPGAWVFYPFHEWGWEVADQIARVNGGDDPVPADAATMLQVVTASNVDDVDPDLPDFPENYTDAYKKLWGI